MSNTFNSSFPQNTQNSVVPAVSLDFADIAHTSGELENLIAVLEKTGVRLTADADKILFDAPKGAVTDELRQRIRTHREGLLELIRSDSGNGACEKKTVDAGWHNSTEGVKAIFGGDGDSPTERPDIKGLDDFVLAPEQVRPVVVSDNATSVDLHEVPVCDGCSRLSDTITAIGTWACSRCEPQRSKATTRLLELRAELLHRSGPRWSPPPGPRDYLNELLSDLRKASSDASSRIIDDPTLQVACTECYSRSSHLILIHEGRSLRRDCSGCGRFIDNPVWRNLKMVKEFINQVSGLRG